MLITLIEMSFSASILILIVVVLRSIFLHNMPKKTFLVLWGVVLCRLLVPFSIPSRFSIYTLLDLLGTTSIEQGNVTPFEGLAQAVPNMGGTLTQTAPQTVAFTFLPILMIWTLGLVSCALFFIITHLRCRRDYETSLPIENIFVCEWQQAHPLRRTIKIRQSDKIIAPLTYGIWKPIILLPKATDYSDTLQLQYILTHEFTHIRRFDTLTKCLLVSALCVHWFNPIVWAMFILASRDIEITCDETVVQTFGETMKSAYALTLIDMEEKKSRLTPLCNSFSKNAIEERINAIMKMKKISILGISLALILVVGVTTVFATSAMSASKKLPSTTTPQEQSTSALDDQTENLVLYNTVEVCHYDDGSPYVFVSRANNTDKTIIEILFGMLAFDKDGKPLKLEWTLFDNNREPSYDVIWEDSINLKPKGTTGSDEGDENRGGWSLGWGSDSDDIEYQKLFDQVAYVLCYDKQITFENGEIWNNPDYDKWLETYKGKTVEVEVLKDYYANNSSVVLESSNAVPNSENATTNDKNKYWDSNDWPTVKKYAEYDERFEVDTINECWTFNNKPIAGIITMLDDPVASTNVGLMDSDESEVVYVQVIRENNVVKDFTTLSRDEYNDILYKINQKA